MATNQEKLDKIFDQSVVMKQTTYQAGMDVDNWEVKQAATGRMVSQFDGPREGWGLHTPVTWMGFNGKTPATGRKTTTIATDIGYNDTRWTNLNRKIDTLLETLKALAVATGATIDYDEIAKKVNDEADRRERERLATSTEEN